ncbi:MAG TPA: hydroxymethylbilane synthase [Myxococcota bacterium]|nr:hydroxymethylbilane synthase [Myxococcota bacterium]
MKRIRIATRGSDLALWQARFVAAHIAAKLGHETEIVPIVTSGDRLQGVSLARVGGKGLFVKEIEEALLEGRADVAVHSAKDLPASLPPELALVAFPERADPRDALVVRAPRASDPLAPGASLQKLPRDGRVGTGSVRRAAQLRLARPDLQIVPLRGNVPTRLRKLDEQALAAVVLACAGLERLGESARIAERIDPEVMLPAVAQGALAVQARRADPLAAELAALDHAETAARVAAERAVAAGLGADCNVPLAAFAELQGDVLRVRARVIAPDGARVVAAELSGPASEARGLGAELASQLRARGADAILAACRAEPAAS